MYIVRDREAGNIIEFAETIDEAKKIINQYEEEDKNDGVYEPNFYEFTELTDLCDIIIERGDADAREQKKGE